MFKQWIRRIAALAVVICVMFQAPSVSAETGIEADVAAGGAILYEPQSGRVLFEQQAHVVRSMASTTKLMTALVAAETLPLDRRVTVTNEAVAVIGSSMGLRGGDVLTVEDLLKGLLLASGNDAANVLALCVSPTLEAFAARMNERAALIGMTRSHFVTPSGLDADGHGSTPYDMALLAAEVLKNETLAAICAMRNATVTVGDRMVTLTNHNKLLATYDGAIGMKTGFTQLAGRCLVSAAKRDGVTLIAVTLHCADDWRVHTSLLDQGFSLVKRVTLSPPTLADRTVFGGIKTTLSLEAESSSATMLAMDEAAVETVVCCPPYMWAPVKAGDTVGTVEYRLRGECLARVPITATCDVPSAKPLTFGQSFVRCFSALLARALM